MDCHLTQEQLTGKKEPLMAYKIKSNLDVAAGISVQGEPAGVSITTTGNTTQYIADSGGHVDIPLPTKTNIDYVLKQLPLSQYGKIDGLPVNVTADGTGFIFHFNDITPLLIGGQYFDVPVTNINLTSIKANPASTLFYCYIKLELGTPLYVISLVELPENTIQMFIGTVQTDSTKISSLQITKVSRIDTYRPSLTQVGSAFPVSSGNPNQTGSINW